MPPLLLTLNCVTEITMKAVKTAFAKLYIKPVAFCLCHALLLNLVVEFLSRRSVIETAEYIITSPLVFICNLGIIMLTFVPTFIVRRRAFWQIFISILWLVGAVANFCLQSVRTMPFSIMDIFCVKYAIAVAAKYYTVAEMVIMVLLIGAVIFGLVWAFVKTPRRPKNSIPVLKTMLVMGVVTACVLFSTTLGVRTDILATDYGNITEAYLDYGFPYCFCMGIIGSGIDEPEDYSEEAVLELIEEPEPEADRKPNIIFLQLESFYDTSMIPGLECERDPLDYWHSLEAEYGGGDFLVPVVGAGTANTEFESITGMNIDFFGPGEYPYRTVLLDEYCESMAWNLSELGYTSIAMHNNDGTFYWRDRAFDKLGFDYFQSIEYMDDLEYTESGWAYDSVLTAEILKSLDASDGQDYIYCISVQGHGSYPTEEFEGPKDIGISGEYSDEDHYRYLYYVNQMAMIDDFLEDLTAELAARDEETVLIMYGDHLPALPFADELPDEELYRTRYIIWSNCGIRGDGRDLEAYSSPAYITELLGIETGIINRYHQTNADEADYLEGLEMLQYDMLYGEKYVYDEQQGFPEHEAVMGVTEIAMTGWEIKDGRLYVYGEGFTEFSHITADSELSETEFIDEHTLVTDELPEEAVVVFVSQAGKDGVILSQTEGMLIPASEENAE